MRQKPNLVIEYNWFMIKLIVTRSLLRGLNIINWFWVVCLFIDWVLYLISKLEQHSIFHHNKRLLMVFACLIYTGHFIRKHYISSLVKLSLHLWPSILWTTSPYLIFWSLSSCAYEPLICTGALFTHPSKIYQSHSCHLYALLPIVTPLTSAEIPYNMIWLLPSLWWFHYALYKFLSCNFLLCLWSWILCVSLSFIYLLWQIIHSYLIQYEAPKMTYNVNYIVWIWQAEYKRIQSPLKYQTRCLAAFPDQQGFLVRYLTREKLWCQTDSSTLSPCDAFSFCSKHFCGWYFCDNSMT